MRLKFSVLVAAIALMIALLFTAEAKNLPGSNHDIKGIWQGTLTVPNGQLRIVFKISEDTQGNLKAIMESPDQTSRDFAVDSISFDGKNLRLESNTVRGYYQGEYNPDSLSFAGTWNQMGRSFPLVLKKVEKVEKASQTEIKRPQEPKPPFPYKVEDVVYENKSAGIRLGGTLTMPESGGPFVAVLLITGSGQQNRDEQLFGHKPFLVLADYLTRRGIAVLRVDDRGIGESTGDFAASDSKDFASDVLTGVEYLKSRKEINPKEIGLIGHSEGGMIAPMVADETKDVAFIVLMAGPGIPGDQILLTQKEEIERLSGIPESIIKDGVGLNKKMFDAIKQGKDSSQTADELRKIFYDHYNNLSSEAKNEIKDTKALFNFYLQSMMNPDTRFLIRYDPYPVLEKVKCPVLAIDGSKDVQVPAKEDLAGIKKALQDGGNKNFEVKELPGLNHLFQTAKTGLPSEYSSIEETISPVALQTIGDWIIGITKK